MPRIYWSHIAILCRSVCLFVQIISNTWTYKTEEEKQEEEAIEKEWVWRSHLEHNAKRFQIAGYDGPTLTATEYNERVASIHKCDPKKWTVYNDMRYVKALNNIANKEAAETKKKKKKRLMSKWNKKSMKKTKCEND